MTPTKTAQKLIYKLEQTGENTLEFFKGIEETQWQLQVYSDGPAWGVHNIFAHLTEVEVSVPRLIRNIVAGGSGVPKDFDIDRYNKKHVDQLSRLSREDLLAEHPCRRQETIALVETLNEADFRKRGRHPFLGKSEILEMLRLMMLHSRIHERDVRRALEDVLAGG